MRLLRRIQEQRRCAPRHPAVADSLGNVSYAALWNGAERIAAMLDAHSPGGGRRPIAVCMDKSPQCVAAFLACWMRGVPYIPLSPDAPRDRLLRMIEAADAGAVCIDSPEAGGSHAAMFHSSPASAQRSLLALDRTLCEEGASRTPDNAPLELADYGESDVAAILFTSGSTGQPKAAQITCANLDWFVGWVHESFSPTPEDRIASHAAFKFDLSFLDLWGTLSAGATVHLVPGHYAGSGRAMAHWIQEQGITLWQSVPSALGLIAQAEIVMPRVRHVLFAGERMPHARLLSLLPCFPSARLYNIYGCTETNNTFMYPVPEAAAQIPDPLPIGRPLPGTKFTILDEGGRPVERGSSGVLWVTTPTLMRGYLDAERTDDVVRTLETEDGIRLPFYKTNDVVRETTAGDLEFIGRSDWVVKTSGYRVSLQEIEAAIDTHDAVEEVGVVGVPDDELGHRLVAVVRRSAAAKLDSLAMKLHCSGRLPRYMIPHRFLFRDQPLPKNGNGKLDRKVLLHEISAPQENATQIPSS